ncbi:phosphonate C-P lyase system protein PhnG [Rhizobium halophytocola]|uniref:Alpha-D-ribose 1-methylphosphonate 5-triphosphate synthase subunit PhnG n=1 Tax=Rhizobium halophytocola TaxID=735519 RepID=A0ABS4E1B5_9HYPH|nr:phosphonate C-P lyase system protein PhnG [Rhizobium halophytocola]MBP1851704.1 alpha-D-ribose 1-methylphosphonate 5-triphosphate synthase subunit PhnG [Rhizobium halophytocola]
MATAGETQQSEQLVRKQALDLLAKAELRELQAAWDRLEPKPAVAAVRGPETGLVMVRGRTGGGGSPFNLGEVTVTRASVRVDDTLVGHGYALGTDSRKVRLAAIFDALGQKPEMMHAIQTQLLGPIAERLAEADRQTRAETAATRVDFFTMVRGEDK